MRRSCIAVAPPYPGAYSDTARGRLRVLRSLHPTVKIGPFGGRPTLFTDDGNEPNLMGADPLERAKIEMWDRRVELTYFMQIAGWFRNSHPAMAELEKPQNPDWAATCSDRAKRVAKFLDRALGETPYVAGDRFTIADITLHVSMGFGKLVKYKPWEGFANIAAWRDRVTPRPGLAL